MHTQNYTQTTEALILLTEVDEEYLELKTTRKRKHILPRHTDKWERHVVKKKMCKRTNNRSYPIRGGQKWFVYTWKNRPEDYHIKAGANRFKYLRLIDRRKNIQFINLEDRQTPSITKITCYTSKRRPAICLNSDTHTE